MKKLLVILLGFCFALPAFAGNISSVSNQAWLDHVGQMKDLRQQILSLVTKDRPTIEDRQNLDLLNLTFAERKAEWENYLENAAQKKESTELVASGTTEEAAPVVAPEKSACKDACKGLSKEECKVPWKDKCNKCKEAVKAPKHECTEACKNMSKEECKKACGQKKHGKRHHKKARKPECKKACEDACKGMSKEECKKALKAGCCGKEGQCCKQDKNAPKHECTEACKSMSKEECKKLCGDKEACQKIEKADKSAAVCVCCGKTDCQCCKTGKCEKDSKCCK